MLSIEQVAARVESLKHRSSERDSRHQDVLSVRKGNISEVYPEFFPEGVDANVVANFIDIVARDLSEVMAPLPAVNCSAVNLQIHAHVLLVIIFSIQIYKYRCIQEQTGTSHLDSFLS
jgi:hypothetical protein